MRARDHLLLHFSSAFFPALFDLTGDRHANAGACVTRSGACGSAWSRVLRLVASGLEANGIPSVSLLSSATGNVDARADAIQQFQNDPEIKVILIIMSTGGQLLALPGRADSRPLRI